MNNPLSLPFNLSASCRWREICPVTVLSHVVTLGRAAVPGARRPPGAGLAGFGAPAGQAVVARMFRNPRRTRAGARRPGGAGFSKRRRRPTASGRARRSWAWQAMMSQVRRSAAAGARIAGTVHPRTCLSSLNVCSMSKRRKNACQHRSMSAGMAPVADHHSHTGLGLRSPGR